MVECPICKYEGNKIEVREIEPDYIQKLISCNKCGFLLEIQNRRHSPW
jgi:transcription initiation factor TFIIIB Brf1 subunit/transcription initiation factor TFIIB